MRFFPESYVAVKAPYRISLGGGGTDLPFYSQERGGLLLTAAINRYMTVLTSRRVLDDMLLVQTTDVQFAAELDDLKHLMIRENLKYFEFTHGIQVATFTTLPTSIGLGSSSCLNVALVKALSTMAGRKMSELEVAKLAHHIERERLGLAGGVQDHYISALGGIQKLTVSKTGEVDAEYFEIAEHHRLTLQKGLILIYTGKERDSAKVISSQVNDQSFVFDIYDRIKEIGVLSQTLLREGDLDGLGKAMDAHWLLKKRLSAEISNSRLDELYIKLKELGSPGGKIVGAGGGGFFMMVVPDHVDQYLKKIHALGYRHLDWQFDFKGCHIIDQQP